MRHQPSPAAPESQSRGVTASSSWIERARSGFASDRHDPFKTRDISAALLAGTNTFEFDYYGAPQKPPLHRFEQHWAGELQGWPLPRQLTACAGCGATIETTAGMAMAAVMPSARTTSRRFIPATVLGINDSSLSK